MEWKGQLLVDTCLPFGLRSAPLLFTAVADALEFMIRQKGVEDIGHYLDDFVVLGPPGSEVCGTGLQVAMGMSEEAGLPVAPHKTMGPATVIPFLGIEIDSEKMELRLPTEKLKKLKELLSSWRRRKQGSKKELQSLAGHLNHACKVVRPGRRFVRGLFGLLSKFHRADHPIRVNAALKADIEWWWVFVESWNGVSMLLQDSLQSPGVEFWSDASGSWGCGAIWGREWCQIEWKRWPDYRSASIAVKELLPVVVATAIWGKQWRGSVVRCHCDNQSVVDVIRGGYCKDPVMANMLRCLFYLEAQFNMVLTAVHVAGVDNEVADAISRNKMDVFFNLVPQAMQAAAPCPEGLIQKLVLQETWTPAIWKSWLGALSKDP